MVLDKIEKLLIEESKRPDYRLADYFDYVSGTSTGGIIAAGIAMGMSVAEILAFYVNNGAKMFDKASIFRRLQTKFESEPLALQLKSVFGAATTLGAAEIEVAAAPSHAQRNNRFALANFKQPVREIQRSDASRLQSAIAAVATGAREYGSSNLFSPGSHYLRRQAICVRRWWRHDVQQSGFSDVSDGDCRPVLDQRAAGSDAAGKPVRTGC